MTIENIKQNLTERFSALLQEFYKRRIVFWFDPEKEFEDVIDELVPDGVKLLKLTGSNNFTAKKLLEHDDAQCDYLVYDPTEHGRAQDNWLHDIELYSESFSADRISMFMQDLGIPDEHNYRKALKDYSKFLASQDRVGKLKAFGTKYTSVGQLNCDIIAVLLGVKDNSSRGIIKSLMIASLRCDDSDMLENITKFGNDDAFRQMLINSVGFSREAIDLNELAAHVIISAAASELGDDMVDGLEKYISEQSSKCDNCYSLISDWQHSGDSDVLYEIIAQVNERLQLNEKFRTLEYETLQRASCLPCFDELLLEKMFSGLINDSIRTDELISVCESRKLCGWIDKYRDVYDGISCAAQMIECLRESMAQLHVSQYSELWSLYTEKLCYIDTYYRKFCLAFERSVKHPIDYLDDVFKTAAERVENIYKNEYLCKLGSKWSALIADDVREDMCLVGIEQQCEFYKRKVQSIVSGGSRVYVIISDAFRYEAAKELEKRLTAETNGNAKLSSMQSVFPSATKYGMAALLPHSDLELTDNMKVNCDGSSTSGTSNRDKILKKSNARNAAVKYTDLMAMKKEDRRALVNGADVVYIYHNSIDAMGEEAATENQVFEACETAMEEIKSAVKMICGTLSGSNIIITADHGFLYSRSPLEESEKLDKHHITGEIKELDRRYAVTSADSNAEYMLDVSLNRYGTDYKGFAPQESIRIKMQGGGVNYVHGGMSLQEIVVPVIEFKNYRADSKNFVDIKKVQLQLLAESRRITTSSVFIRFYQVEPVEGKTIAASFEVYFTDKNGNIISDVHTITADKVSQNAQDRVFKVNFAMKGEQFSDSEVYYLNIADKDSKEVLAKEDYKINIAFADDFDF